MKKGLVIVISICLAVAIIGAVWLYTKPSEEQPPLGALNADEFFSETSEILNGPFNQSTNWTLYDKIEKVYAYKIPELNLLNQTFDLNVMNEYTAVKFESSYNYLYLEGNHTNNFTIGEYITHIEKVRYIEGYELELLYKAWNLGYLPDFEGKYMPNTRYNVDYRMTFIYLSYGFTTFNYTTEILNETALKITITNVPEYYPYPVQWNQVNYSASWHHGDGHWSHFDIDSFEVYENNQKFFTFINYSCFYGNGTITEGQYMIINADLSKEFRLRIFSLKFHECFEQPHIFGLGDELFEIHFIP